jgi:putative tricarboxylic transport membrane protein
MENLIHGLSALGNGPSIAYLVGGAVIGMIIGAIPGLSTVAILSIILVFVPRIDLTGTLCLFLGAQGGSFYSASISAILLNTPGHPEAFPITLDGYPMARNGQPGRALGLSACSTCIGGFLGCAVLVGFLPLLNELPTFFHPADYLALVTLALLMVGTLGTNSVGKAVVSAGAGLLLGAIGPSPTTGVYRYTFNAVGLYGGISLVALALGTFAIVQMTMVFGTGTATASQDMTGRDLGKVAPMVLKKGVGRELVGGIVETFRYWVVLLQGGILGGLMGIIPGIGGFTGNYLSYGIARQTSRRRDLFGTGIAEGIVAPEGSSLAKEAGHMIPLIGLGIPGGVAGALFLAALADHQVRVGYDFQTAHPNVTGEIVWIIALSGLIGTIAGLLVGPQIAKVTRVPGPLIVPFILAICVSSAFLTDEQFFSVIELVVFGILGLGFRRLRYPLGAFVLGLVLGPTFETNIYLTSHINPGVGFIAHRPLADGLFLIAILVLLAKWTELHREAKRLKASFVEEIAGATDEASRSLILRDQQRRTSPYPLLALLMSMFLAAASLFVIIYGVTNYDFQNGAMPVIGGIGILVPTLFFLPMNVMRFIQHRKAEAGVSTLAYATPHDRELASVGALGRPSIGDDGESSMPSLAEEAEALSTTMSGGPYAYGTIQDKSWGRNGQYRREVFAFAWLAALIGLSWIFGFPIGSAFFMALYGLTATKRYLTKFVHRLIFAAASTAVIWLGTYEMFHLTHLLFDPRIKL